MSRMPVVFFGHGSPMIALAAIAFVAIFFSGVPFPMIVLAAGIIGFIGARTGSGTGAWTMA